MPAILMIFFACHICVNCISDALDIFDAIVTRSDASLSNTSVTLKCSEC